MWVRFYQKSVTVAKKIEKSVQFVIGLCFHSYAIKNVDHEAWRARAELRHVHRMETLVGRKLAARLC